MNSPRSLLVLGVALVLAGTLPVSAAVPAAVASAQGKARTYIVRMADDPVVAYQVGRAGLPATKPGRGRKIDPTSPEVAGYAAYLRGRHDAALGALGAGAGKIYDYTYSFNGFAAALTTAQVEALRARPDVLSVTPDAHHRLSTDNSPAFLDLDSANGGLWTAHGLTGEDVIIGVIDSGIWPEHPSFSDQIDLAYRPGNAGSKTRAYGPPPAGWHGICQTGEDWTSNACNNKLIGARYFVLGHLGRGDRIEGEYRSSRDADGHGTHTAGTAGGNTGVEATILGIRRGTISGVAPRARIAVYKAFWSDGTANSDGGFSSDIVAAIDAAVADGVDVINYSAGDGFSVFGPSAIAFMHAAEAGVFVAVGAGNSGPARGTLPASALLPWVTTVGASTQSRTFQGAARLGSGATYSGASVTGGTATLPLVDAASAGSSLCIPGELDPAVVAGTIVLCERGVVARVEKSRAVSQAGGAGMIMFNAEENQTPVSDNHWVPSVHIDRGSGLAIKAYIAANSAAATGQIVAGEHVPVPAPQMADFSSRNGQNAFVKPDVTAPGVTILAGHSPTSPIGAPGQLFQTISGTSMSTPHVAGLGALLTQAHPDWTPAMLKSALMTSAYQQVTKEDGVTLADPTDMGAGHVNPNAAIEPGLVYNAGFEDYAAYLCGEAQHFSAEFAPLPFPPEICASLAARGISFDPSNVNLPSIAFGGFIGAQTVVRTVTNVGPAGTYTVHVDVPGYDVVVTPRSLTLAQGQSASYRVAFTKKQAPLDTFAFGSLTWSDGAHRVRIPVQIWPVAFAAPAAVAGDGGKIAYTVSFGYDGPFAVEAKGLVAPITQAGTVADDPANDFITALHTGVGVTVHTFVVPPGARAARFALFDAFTDGADDLDLILVPEGVDPEFAGCSCGPTSEEDFSLFDTFNLDIPTPGTYTLYVHGRTTDGPDASYTLFAWIVGDSDYGTTRVSAPARARIGGPNTITLSFSDLAPHTKYLGTVDYLRNGVRMRRTIVEVETR